MMKQPDQKKMKTKKFKIQSGTYPYPIRVIICKDKQTVIDYVNKKQRRKGQDIVSKENFRNANAIYCRSVKYLPILWMPESPKSNKKLCSLAHEILHAVFDCMNDLGIYYSRDSEEAFTYLHSHLMKQFFKEIGRVGSGRNKETKKKRKLKKAPLTG